MAGCLIVFVVFIPFFAFREPDRVLGGEGRIWRFFFRGRDNRQNDAHDDVIQLPGRER